MDNFLQWFFSFITTMFKGVWNGIKSFFLGIVAIFNFPAYFGMLGNYNFQWYEWIFIVLSIILVYAFWAGLIFLIVILIRKYIRFRKTVVGKEDLLEEIADLNRNVVKLTKEKEEIIKLKVGANLSVDDLMNAENPEDAARAAMEGEGVPAEGPADQRFYRLAAVDEKYTFFEPKPYENNYSLSEICDALRNYACSNNKLYYDIKTIRLMIAGLSSTKMVLLQGISGTGKTSLPYVMGKFFQNDATIASVQPSWRDRSELFGYFNEFTKKFNETEVLRRIYESGYNDDINIIVLDEMNIARVEYYFAEMLSILEMPDPTEWKIQLVSAVWDSDPKKLVDGKLSIPENIWYVGTANNDDSTFSISDKVYDRAFIINLDSKGVPFKAQEQTAIRVSYSYVADLYKKAVNEDPVSQELLDQVEQLDNYVIEHFRVAFGNRILKQLKTFIPVYRACGGSTLEGLDYMLATKVFRKFEMLNLGLIRDEIKGLINQLDNIFGKDKMTECIAYLRRLQKSY